MEKDNWLPSTILEILSLVYALFNQHLQESLYFIMVKVLESDSLGLNPSSTT